jgi:cytochrome c oxidase assembly protein subunit 15
LRTVKTFGNNIRQHCPHNSRMTNENLYSRWPHRLAWALTCTTLPLILLGSMVTNYGAGMAVEDWPTTFGYWFYPIKAWLAFWDLFLEHGHRMLAQAVGLLAIALAVVLWRKDSRRWMWLMGLAVVLGVVSQGVLGGFRVIYDATLLAKIHGCTAPLFFALCAAVVTFTSTKWLANDGPREYPSAPRLQRLTLVLAVAFYLEIVLGAQLRHQLSGAWAVNAWTGWFELWVWLKLIGAGLLAAGVVWLLVYVSRNLSNQPMIIHRTQLLAGLFLTQTALGAAAWVTKYGWPGWFTDNLLAIDYTVVAEGPLQTTVRTAHVGVGACSLAVALSLALWSRRLLRGTGP